MDYCVQRQFCLQQKHSEKEEIENLCFSEGSLQKLQISKHS